jgi:NAD(P)-dependent dehydrogenase (short-subunit alcohol dehydrogenase family)
LKQQEKLTDSCRAKVFIADRDRTGAKAIVQELNAQRPGSAFSAQVDVASWDSQLQAFQTAAQELGRIDYVYPIAGIGERRLLPPGAGTGIEGFVKPNLEVRSYG